MVDSDAFVSLVGMIKQALAQGREAPARPAAAQGRVFGAAAPAKKEDRPSSGLDPDRQPVRLSLGEPWDDQAGKGTLIDLRV